MARLVAWLVLALAAQCAAAKEASWVEEALMQDGRTVEVKRTVIWRFSGTVLSEALTRYPSEYALEFRHPTRGTRIEWHGVDKVNPFALQVIADVPYLGVFGNGGGVIYRNSALYGCPEVPFAFLKYNMEKRAWEPIAPKDAPTALRTANLSFFWWESTMEPGRLSAADIAKANAVDRGGVGYLQQPVPVTAAEWRYKYAKRDWTSRAQGDCRPPLEMPVDVVFPMKDGVLTPAAVAVEPEILDRKDFNPPWVISDASPEWKRLMFGDERIARCRTLFRVANADDARIVGWVVFGKDFSRLTRSSAALCEDDALWFFGRESYSPKDDRWVIAKVSPAGEVLYRLSFHKPDYWGFIASPSLARKDGYLYFDWWDADTSTNRNVKKILKMRVKEPG